MDDEICDKRTACVVLVPCGSVIFVLAVLVIVFSINPPYDISKSSCQDDWIGYYEKCYYFSDTMENRTTAAEKCNTMKASLADIDNVKAVNFMMRYKGDEDHWIGVTRNTINNSWLSGDRRLYDNTYLIKGLGECAFLSNDMISSTFCSRYKKWICAV